jgi:plasmid maintenance system antidote protein VapI
LEVAAADVIEFTMTRRERQEELKVVQQLKDAIRATGLTHRDIARAADIGPDILSRFMSGQRDLTLKTAARICRAVGLELTPEKKPKGKPREES